MDAWETWFRQVANSLATARRVRDEGGDPGAVDAVVDYLEEARALIQKHRPPPTTGIETTFPTNGREGDPSVASQVAELQRLATLGELISLPPPPPETVWPFLPEHLAELYASNHPTGEE